MRFLMQATCIALLVIPRAPQAVATDEIAQEFRVSVKRWSLLYKTDVTLFGLHDTVDVSIGPPVTIDVKEGGLKVGEKKVGQAELTVAGHYGSETATLRLTRLEALEVSGSIGVLLNIIQRDEKGFTDARGHRYRLEKGDPLFPDADGPRKISTTLRWNLKENAVRLEAEHRDTGKRCTWIRVPMNVGEKKK